MQSGHRRYPDKSHQGRQTCQYDTSKEQHLLPHTGFVLHLGVGLDLFLTVQIEIHNIRTPRHLIQLALRKLRKRRFSLLGLAF